MRDAPLNSRRLILQQLNASSSVELFQTLTSSRGSN